MNASPSMSPLFSFGTLMDADLLTLVSGQSSAELSLESAQLAGFAQRQVEGDDFPVLVADTNAQTDGTVISGLTSLALQRILFFEGEEYALSPITVTLSQGREQSCVYFKDTAIYQVKDTVWDFQQWVLHEKADFLRRTDRYMTYFGKLTTAEADKYW